MDTHETKLNRGDEEELKDTKLGGVYLTDSRLQFSQVCLQLMIWALGLQIMR